MSVNAREETMEHIEIFKKPALFTNSRIDMDSVPEGWYCYDLRGSDFDPGRPSMLEDKVAVNHAGSVLSPTPLKRSSTEFRRLNGTLNFLGEDMTLAEFCEQHGLDYPTDTRKYILRPASPDEAGLFYSGSDKTETQQAACVGYLRLDFGRSGTEFWHTWWPDNNDELTVPAFKAELDEMVNEMRARGPLRDFAAMSAYCAAHPSGLLDGGARGSFGFITESEHYCYCLRCIPERGDYNGYLYAYDKRQLELGMTQPGLTETGRQMLREAADPNKPHTYEWFVIEDMDQDDENLTGGLPLEKAIQQFAGAECGIKVLGVTKDGISTVDLVVTRYGELEHLPYFEDMESFRQDPVIAAAVQKLHQALDSPEQTSGLTMT